MNPRYALLRLPILVLTLLLASADFVYSQEPAAGTEAAEEQPTNPFVWKERGEKAYASGDFEAAGRLFRRYFNMAYHQDILMDALQPLMRSLIYSGDVAGAEKLLEEVPKRMAEIVPASAPAEKKQLTPVNQQIFLYWQGRVDFLQGRVDVALVKFLKASEEPSPETIKTLGNLGAAEAYVSKEQWTEAEARFRQVEEAHLDEVQRQQATIGMIRALIMQAKYDEADTRIRAEWDDATGQYRTQMGMLYIVSLLARKYVSQAYAIYKDAFVREVDYLNSPMHYGVIRSLGRALMESGDYDSATLVFERMLPLVNREEQKQEILLDLADAGTGAGQQAAAIRHLQKFIQLYPTDSRIVTIRFRIAQLYEKLENHVEAITWYEQVYNQEAAPAELRYQAAQRIAWISRDNLQNYARAVHFFEAAARLPAGEEQQARSLFYAAETRALIEDFNSAAAQYGRVADTFPSTTFAGEARYKQGIAYYRSKQYALAAEAFGKFIEGWPEDTKIADALLKQGLAQRLADLNSAAKETLEKFATTYPESTDAPYALLRASDAASANQLPAEAIRLLTRIIENYSDSQHFPYALYNRAYLNLAQGQYEPAVADSVTFLNQFGKTLPDLAPDVLLWLGDHFATLGRFDDAERYFMNIVRDFPQSSDAPIALYEAAWNYFKQRDYKEAIDAADMLLKRYPDAPARVRAQALFLRADIATLTGEFDLAAQLLTQAIELVPRTRLHYAALGRLGESHYNLGNAVEKPDEARPHYLKALASFAQIIDELENTETSGRDSLVEKARYRKARVHEVLKQTTQARAEYNDIFWSYKNEEIEGNRIFDWYYFARAGFDLARLYIDEGQYSSAIAIYRRLAESNIPIADDARARARELARSYQLTPSGGTPSPTP